MSYKHVFYTLGLVLLLGISSNLAAQDAQMEPKMGISPPRLEFQLEAGRVTKSFQVVNLQDKPLHIELSAADWELDEKNKVRQLAPTEQSLSEWLIFNPVRFSIPANSAQTVRLAVAPKIEPSQGEHRAMIYIQQAPDETEIENTSAQRISFRYGLPIYVHVGSPTRLGEVHGVDFTLTQTIGEPHYKGLLDIDASSTGSAYVRLSGDYYIWAAENYPGDDRVLNLAETRQLDLDSALVTGKLNGRPLLPGSRRTIRTGIDLIPADKIEAYDLVVRGNLGETPFMDRITLKIEPANKQ